MTSYCILCGVRGSTQRERVVPAEVAGAYRLKGLEAVWDLRDLDGEMRDRLWKMLLAVGTLDPPPPAGTTKEERIRGYIRRSEEDRRVL